MKTATEKYNAVLEGKMAKQEFVRQMRQQFPNFVSQFNGFDDSVQILKNKGMIFEVKKEKDNGYKVPEVNIPLDAIERGVDMELEAAGIDSAGIVTKEQYLEAKRKALHNLKKNMNHYINLIAKESSKVDKNDKMKVTKRGAQDKDTFNDMKKANLKEGIHDRDILQSPAGHIKNTYKQDQEYSDSIRASFKKPIVLWGQWPDLRIGTKYGKFEVDFSVGEEQLIDDHGTEGADVKYIADGYDKNGNKYEVTIEAYKDMNGKVTNWDEDSITVQPYNTPNSGNINEVDDYKPGDTSFYSGEEEYEEKEKLNKWLKDNPDPKENIKNVARVLKEKFGQVPGFQFILKEFLSNQLQSLKEGSNNEDVLEQFDSFVDEMYNNVMQEGNEGEQDINKGHLVQITGIVNRLARGYEDKESFIKKVLDTIRDQHSLEEKKAKPDYIDIDGDEDTKEPMKKAAKDAKKSKQSQLKEAVKTIITKVLTENTITEAQTARLADYSDMYPQVEGMKEVVIDLQNIVTDIESFYVDVNKKVNDIFSKIGEKVDNVHDVDSLECLNNIKTAFDSDLEPVQGIFPSGIKLPSVKQIVNTEPNDSSDDVINKQTVFSPRL